MLRVVFLLLPLSEKPQVKLLFSFSRLKVSFLDPMLTWIRELGITSSFCNCDTYNRHKNTINRESIYMKIHSS